MGQDITITIPAAARANASDKITLYGSGEGFAALANVTYRFAFSGTKKPRSISATGTKDAGGALFSEAYESPDADITSWDFKPEADVHVSFVISDFSGSATASDIAALVITLTQKGQGMKFTQLPANVWQQIQINAGILCSGFTPATGTVTASSILGATSGGISIKATPSFSDMGDDIDNCPKNTKELKKVTAWGVKASGNFASMTAALAKSLVGAGAIDGTDSTKIVPSMALASADFADLWFVGDYSDKNGSTNGGFVAVKILNALSTGGLSIQTTDQEKGKFAFEYTGHIAIASPDTPPFEVYVHAGANEPTT